MLIQAYFGPDHRPFGEKQEAETLGEFQGKRFGVVLGREGEKSSLWQGKAGWPKGLQAGSTAPVLISDSAQVL